MQSMRGRALSERALHEDVFLRNISSLAAIVCLVWEHIITFRDEYRYIWRGSMNRVKALYLFSRYFSLCTQVANVWVLIGPLSYLPVPVDHCKIWFIAGTVCSALVLATLDIVMMLRVFVLYNRSLKVGLFLPSLMVAQIILISTCTSRSLDAFPFSPGCDVLITPYDIIYFMAGVITSQTVLLIMTVAKRKAGFGQSPVVNIVVRDGVWVFAVVVGLFVTTIPYSLFVQISRPHIIFVWPVTVFSIATCRLIINMHKVEINNRPNETSSTDADITFTTFLDVSVDSRTF